MSYKYDLILFIKTIQQAEQKLKSTKLWLKANISKTDSEICKKAAKNYIEPKKKKKSLQLKLTNGS